MFVCADDGSHDDTAARTLVTGADTRVEEMTRIGESTTVRGDCSRTAFSSRATAKASPDGAGAARTPDRPATGLLRVE